MKLIRVFVCLLSVLGTRSSTGAELTMDQKLIVACYQLDINGVVKTLRAGANIDARLGEIDDEASKVFFNRWRGSWPGGFNTWTPLIAIAMAPSIPPPPTIAGDVWLNESRVSTLQNSIPRKEIESREKTAQIIMQILLSHNCNVDIGDVCGTTALHCAVEFDRAEMVQVLLEFGANPNTRQGVYIDGPDDITPLHICNSRKINSRKIMQYLLDHGADPLAKDSNGNTPIDLLRRDDSRTFDLIMDSGVPRIVDRMKDGHLKDR